MNARGVEFGYQRTLASSGAADGSCSRRERLRKAPSMTRFRVSCNLLSSNATSFGFEYCAVTFSCLGVEDLILALWTVLYLRAGLSRNKLMPSIPYLGEWRTVRYTRNPRLCLPLGWCIVQLLGAASCMAHGALVFSCQNITVRILVWSNHSRGLVPPRLRKFRVLLRMYCCKCISCISYDPRQRKLLFLFVISVEPSYFAGLLGSSRRMSKPHPSGPVKTPGRKRRIRGLVRSYVRCKVTGVSGDQYFSSFASRSHQLLQKVQLRKSFSLALESEPFILVLIWLFSFLVPPSSSP